MKERSVGYWHLRRKSAYAKTTMCIGVESHTRISNSHSEQLVDHVANDLDGVIASLVANRIAHEQPAASQCRCASYFWMVLIQVRKSAVVDKLVEYMSYASGSERSINLG